MKTMLVLFETWNLVDQWITFNEPIVPVNLAVLIPIIHIRVDAEAPLSNFIPNWPAGSWTCIMNSCPDSGGIILNGSAYHCSILLMSRLLMCGSLSGPIFLRSVCLGTYPQELVEILHEQGLLPDATGGRVGAHSWKYSRFLEYQLISLCVLWPSIC